MVADAPGGLQRGGRRAGCPCLSSLYREVDFPGGWERARNGACGRRTMGMLLPRSHELPISPGFTDSCWPTAAGLAIKEEEGRMPLRMRVHDREPIGMA